MTVCCGTTPELAASLAAADAEAWARDAGPGLKRLDMIAPAIHCGQCISTIERGLKAEPGVETARVNFTLRQVAVTWRASETTAQGILDALERIGYPAQRFCARLRCRASPPPTSCCCRSRSGRARKGRRATCSTGSRR
jgi:copper chaperone CopZ